MQTAAAPHTPHTKNGRAPSPVESLDLGRLDALAAPPYGDVEGGVGAHDRALVRAGRRSGTRPMSEHLFATGTPGAIGGAVARALRRRHPSSSITLVDVSAAPSEALAASLGGDVAVLPCD